MQHAALEFFARQNQRQNKQILHLAISVPSIFIFQSFLR